MQYFTKSLVFPGLYSSTKSLDHAEDVEKSDLISHFKAGDIEQKEFDFSHMDDLTGSRPSTVALPTPSFVLKMILQGTMQRSKT